MSSDEEGAGEDEDPMVELDDDEGDVSSWDTCLKEGYLQKRGGTMGQKKHKQRFFRMRDYMILYYKKRKPSYGKPDGKIPQAIVLFAASLDDPEYSTFKIAGEVPNSFMIVCSSRIFRLAAESASERDAWVHMINTHIVRQRDELKGSEYGFKRAIRALGSLKPRTKIVQRCGHMCQVLEEECRRDFTIGHVLTRVEAAEAQGREADIYAARLTQEAFEQANESMTAITNYFDVDSLLVFVRDMGLNHHQMETPEVQQTFASEYHRAKSLFKGLEQEDDDEEEADDELFTTELLYEGPLGMSKIEDGKKQTKVWVALFEDKLAWWKKKQAKDRGKHSDGHYYLRDVLQAVNTKHHNFRVAHFDEHKSMYFFTANQVETERWIDQVSHAVIAYNRLDPAQIAEMYEEKEAKTRGTFDTVQNTVRRTLNARKKEMPMHWTLVIQWFETYFADLFVRIKTTRIAGNTQRVAVTKNNPHMAKRRVAAELDALVERLALIKAAIKVVPLVEEHARALKEKQQAAQMILDQASDENLQKMSEIYSMLDNTLADEEDLSVAGATFT